MIATYIYIMMNDSDTGRKLREAINRWFPGLIKKPVSVRVPVNQR